MGMMIFSAIVLGCSVATMIVGLIMWDSNRIGDSKGSFKNFSKRPINVISKRKVGLFDDL